MRLFRSDIYRAHVVIELLVQARDEAEAKEEIKRAWHGWQLRHITEVLSLTRTWKINEWTTD